MGILNLTPDSFSDKNSFSDKSDLKNIDFLLKRIEKMINDGMDILDIGGESTKPGYIKISDQEEIERVIPKIEIIKRNFEIPISLDTYKFKVAKEGIKVGVNFINDIWGLKYDKGEMAHLIAKNNLPCCLMHNRRDINYNNFFEDVISDMKETLNIALKSGISREKIIIDPGIGFAKTYENNLDIINHLDIFRSRLGQPVLLGASKKSVIGQALSLPISERMEGTIATTVIGVIKGASIIRVHDIKENARAIKMTKAIIDKNK